MTVSLASSWPNMVSQHNRRSFLRIFGSNCSKDVTESEYVNVKNYTRNKLENSEIVTDLRKKRLPKFFGNLVVQFFSKHFTVFSLRSVRSFDRKVERLFSELIVVLVLGDDDDGDDALIFLLDDISSGDDEEIIVFSVKSSVISDESTIAIQLYI